MTTFTWVPEFGSSREFKPTVSKVQFGEGYQQRISFGMNTLPQNWTLSFANRSPSEGNAILNFLIARGAVEAFLWTPPNGSTPLKFVCATWGDTPVKGGYMTITANFEQVFEP